MRTFYDSTSPAALPAKAAGYFGYIDGALIKPNYEAVLKVAKGRPVVPTSTDPNDLSLLAYPGIMLDCERGDYDPATAIVRAKSLLSNKNGCTPTIYVDLSNWADLKARARAARIPTKVGRLGNLQWCVADWTGHEHEVPGAIATQWADPLHGSGGHYDVTAAADYWPGVDALEVPLGRLHRRYVKALNEAWRPGGPRDGKPLPAADHELVATLEHRAAHVVDG